MSGGSRLKSKRRTPRDTQEKMIPIEWSQSANKTKLAIVRRLMDINLSAALALISTIETETSRLSTYPESGRPGREQGTREPVISGTRYLVIYKIRSAGRMTILRLLHSAQRWPSFKE